MHRIFIVGEVRNDPEYQEKENGQKVATFDLISYEDQVRRSGYFNFRCIAYDRRAQMVHECVRKGNKLGVIGHFRFIDRGILGIGMGEGNIYNFLYHVILDNLELNLFDSAVGPSDRSEIE